MRNFRKSPPAIFLIILLAVSGGYHFSVEAHSEKKGNGEPVLSVLINNHSNAGIKPSDSGRQLQIRYSLGALSLSKPFNKNADSNVACLWNALKANLSSYSWHRDYIELRILKV